jgi:hypothetical protein
MAKFGPLATLADVALYLGANEPTNESLSRRVYKDTDCGAWAKVEEGTQVLRKRMQEWVATLRVGINGVHVVKLRRVGYGATELEKVPPRVREYLQVAEGQRSLTTLTREDFDGLKEDESQGGGEGVLRVTVRSELEKVATFRVEVPQTRQGLYFLCGSIVEGSDAEVTAAPVWLPCKPEEIDTALQYVEEEADRIWDEMRAEEETEEKA